MKNKPKKKFIDFVEDQTDMSPISLSDIPYIEICGENHIEIEGIYKLLRCEPECIKMRFKKKTVSFNGNELYIRNFSEKSAIIKGKIDSITFS